MCIQRNLPVANQELHDMSRLLNELWVMGAYQHQAFRSPFGNDAPHPLGRFRIKKGCGFIEHFHRAVA